MTLHQEEKLDNVRMAVSRLETAFLTVKDCHVDHEKRLRSLEEVKNITKGKVAAVLFLMTSGGVLGAMMAKLLK